MKTVVAFGLAAPMLLLAVVACADQAFSESAPTATQPPSQTEPESKAGPVGAAVKMSSLGVGLDVATRIRPHVNVRMGFNIFSYSDDFTFHGIDYRGPLKFRSLETHVDWFAFAAYPLSGGFRRWSLIPPALVGPMLRLERPLERLLGRLGGFRMMLVIEKRGR